MHLLINPNRWLSPLLFTACAMMGATGCTTTSSQAPAPTTTQTTPAVTQANDPDGQKTLARAQSLQSQGRLEDALNAFYEAISKNPDLIEAHLGVGSIYREQTNYTRAELAYQAAARVDPKNYDAHYFLGLTRHYLGKVGQAIASYRRAIALNPQAYEAHRDLSAAYLQANDARSALTSAQQAVDIDPDDQAGWFNLAAAQSVLEDYEGAIVSYRNAAELGPLPNQIALGLADAHLKLGNINRAVSTLKTLANREDSRALAYERLGYAYFRQRKFDSAGEAYEEAIRANPQSLAALNGLGAVRMTQYLLRPKSENARFEFRDQARALWRKSLSVDPNQTVIVDLLNRYKDL